MYLRSVFRVVMSVMISYKVRFVFTAGCLWGWGGEGVSCLFYVVCVGLRVVVSKTYYAVFYFVFLRLVCPMLSVSVDCPF